jgi:transposase
MHRIGEDVAERLGVVPAQFKVIVTRRPRYGCRACEGAVVQAPAPARLIGADSGERDQSFRPKVITDSGRS